MAAGPVGIGSTLRDGHRDGYPLRTADIGPSVAKASLDWPVRAAAIRSIAD
jgi:hypothetical protein